MKTLVWILIQTVLLQGFISASAPAAAASQRPIALNAADQPLLDELCKDNPDIAVVQNLIKNCTHIDNPLTNTGTIPLCLAAGRNHVAAVQVLIAAGADVNKARTTDGVTPLFIAAERGFFRVVQVLIDAGADVNKASSKSVTPLLMAAQKNHVAVVRVLLEAPDIDVDKTNNKGVTPLLMATQQGYVEVARALIFAGAKVDKALPDNPNATPLFIAVEKGYVEIIQALIAAGADVNKALTAYGATPLYIAAQNGHAAIVHALLQAPNIDVNKATTTFGITPLMIAAQSGHAVVVQELLKAPKIDVNKAKTVGATPLLMAARQATQPNALPVYYQIVHEILKKDKDAQGLCRLSQADQARIAIEAVTHGWIVVLDNMVRHCGFDMKNVRDAQGKPLLFIAIENQRNDVVDYLLSVKSPNNTLMIDVNAPVSYKRMNALMLASELNNPEIMQILISHKINMDAQDAHGETALIKAIKNSNVAAVELLIRRDADIVMQNGISAENFLKSDSDNDRRIANIIQNPRDFRLSFLKTSA